jgi:hypothetical protein
MAIEANVFEGNVLATGALAHFGFGAVEGSPDSTGPRWFVIGGDPNGVYTAPKGSLASAVTADPANVNLWINTDGGTTWVGLR